MFFNECYSIRVCIFNTRYSCSRTSCIKGRRDKKSVENGAKKFPLIFLLQLVVSRRKEGGKDVQLHSGFRGHVHELLWDFHQPLRPRCPPSQ